MAAQGQKKRSTQPQTRKGPGLPVVTVGRFEEALRLVERLYHENVDLFVEAGQQLREQRRAGSQRSLTPEEAAQVAVVLSAGDQEPLEERTQRIQDGGLTIAEEPTPQELLLAGGLHTAPAFQVAVRRFVALVEMPADKFEQACETDTLDDLIDELVTDQRGAGLDEARARAEVAFAHFAAAAGYDPGKAWGTIAQSVWRALTDAMGHLLAESASASLTASAASTEVSPGEPSSTTPDGETPSTSSTPSSDAESPQTVGAMS
jgi:hypothetical protein